MLILAFETSAKAASAALLRDGVLLAEYFQNSGQTHSRTLMKMAQDMLENCDLGAQDVQAVACAAGPGSFTGVRIGLAAAKGFAWAGALPCYGVSTLEAMAQNMACFEGIVCAVMDARRSQVYCALFRAHAGGLTRLTEDQAISLEELEKELEKYAEPQIFVGDGAALCYNVLGQKTPLRRLAPEQLRMQRAGGVALAAQNRIERGEAGDGAALVPNYLRLSQAERERLARLNQKTEGVQ